MADNTTLPGTGDVIGTDDVSGVKYQQVKLMDGTLNSAAVIPGDATNGLDVDVTRVSGNVTVVQGTATNLKVDASGVAVPITDNSGSLTVDQATASSLNATVVQGTASSLKVEPNGAVAHASADSGNPQKIGGRARSSDITTLSNDNRSDFLTDLVGKLIVRPHTLPENTLSGVASATGTADTQVIAAQAAGVRIFISNLSVANSSAATNSIIEVKDGTNVIWRTTAPAGGGSNVHFDPPLRGGTATALNMAALTAATTIYFSASGYKGV